MKRFFYNYWKSLAWAFVIAFLLFSSGKSLPKKSILQIDHLDKLVHLFLFLILEILVLIECNAGKSLLALYRKVSVISLPLLYAAFTELIQLFFVVDRTGDWSDFAADVLGIIIGIALYTLYKKKSTVQY